MTKINKVIIESPYRGDVARNICYAFDCIKDSINRGEAPFASHLLYTEALDDNKQEQREKGINLGFAWAMSADYAVFYVDLGFSEGMKNALEFYKQRGIKTEERKIR